MNIEEELERCDRWFEGGEFLVAPGLENEGAPHCYFWDDFDAVSKLIKENPSYSIYTLIDAEGGGWIIPGYRFVNRMGYFISKTHVPLEDGEELMYWAPSPEVDEDIVEEFTYIIEETQYKEVDFDCDEEDGNGFMDYFFVAKDEDDNRVQFKLKIEMETMTPKTIYVRTAPLLGNFGEWTFFSEWTSE